MEDKVNTFDLSQEQRHTAQLLQELLGRAIAARYEDFCRLSAGAYTINASKPMAAHALRELESMVRGTLIEPMQAGPPEDPDFDKKLKKARTALRETGLAEHTIDDVIKGLKPSEGHKRQIRKLVVQLGLKPDGEIANLWMSLCDNFGSAHKRSFHMALKVDDEFRTKYQQPFDTVIRAILVAIRSRYALLTRQVRTLVDSGNHARAVNSFKSKIPGALPLQWDFYQRLTTEAWLPHLMKAELLGEPLASPPESAKQGRYFGEWPAGSYLLRMAASPDQKTHKLVVEALQAVRGSDHPDVSQTGIAILAALPADVSAPITDIAIDWLHRDTHVLHSQAPLELVKKLASANQTEAALGIAGEVLRLWGHERRILSHFDRSMYEHHLPELVTALTAACGIEALQLFVDLLRQAQVISDNDYSHYSSHTIAENGFPPNDIFDALVNAVRDSSALIIQNQTSTVTEVVTALSREPARIFVRLYLHALALNPSSAPDLATAKLLDAELIEQGWSNAEYSALALAWFPSLADDHRAEVFRVLDAIPDKYLDWWMERFEKETNRPPTADDIQRFRIGCVRDLCWKWRSALPVERREAIEVLGDPDAWHQSFSIPDESPLAATDFSTKPVADIVAFLTDWQPGADAGRQTVTALAQEVRNAAVADPKAYSSAADQFALLRPIYVRRLLEGLQQSASNQKEVDWDSMLRLIERVYKRAGQQIDPSTLVAGDDPGWDWARKAASELLAVGLRLGSLGIPLEHATTVRALVSVVRKLTPSIIDVDDFDNKFERQPFFTAIETARGASTELCILLIRWINRDVEQDVGSSRAAVVADPEIARELEAQLADRTLGGRIPRAIMGRYLGSLYYNDPNWVKSQMTALFPDADADLRNATWQSHLRNGFGPIDVLMPELTECYLQEAARLSSDGDSGEGNELHARQQRFTDYVMCLVLRGTVPEVVLESFLLKSTDVQRKHAMWFVANEVSRPISEAPEDARLRGRAYWESRLATAIASSNPIEFSEELGMISHWCFHGVADELWLCDQVLATVRLGIAPNNSYGTVNWLQKVATRHADRAVEVFHDLIQCPRVERWSYMTNRGPVQVILTEGLDKGTQETVARVGEVISYLSSLGFNDFLDLEPSKPT